MEEERICTHCGEVLSEGEGTTVNGDLLCDECIDDCCITCDHCGEVIYTDTKGGSFVKTAIKSILENEKYCGTYFWNKRSAKDYRGMRNNHKLKDLIYRITLKTQTCICQTKGGKEWGRQENNHL